MIRKATLMYIYPEFQREYKQRHDEIWQELVDVLKSHGAKNYSIFLDIDSNTLFAYVEVEDEKRWNEISNTEVCKKWWMYMKDIMLSNSDNSPVSKELKSVFYME